MIYNYINSAIPMVGIAVCMYAVCSKRIVTRTPANGAFLHLALILWYALVWADWVSTHTPVWQTITARSIMLTMVLLQLKMTKRKKKPCPLTVKRLRRTRYFKNSIKKEGL